MGVLDYIKKNEGLRLKPYVCPAGKLTIGYGHNLDNPISEEVAELILIDDLHVVLMDLVSIFPNNIFSVNRYVALLDLMFNLGKSRFLTFKKMIRAINEEDWDKAADELLDSKYATQVGQRANNNANFLRKG